MNNSYRELIKNKNPNEGNSPPANDCCDHPSIEERGGNKVCLNCGIISERTFVGNERRA